MRQHPTIDYHGKLKRSPYRVSPILLWILAAIYGISLLISARWIVPVGPLVTIADGPSKGYDVAYAVGINHGALTLQRLRRIQSAGFDFHFGIATPHLLPSINRGWPVSTLECPLILLYLCFMAIIWLRARQKCSLDKA